jgi:hypothetical protein
MKPVLGHKTSVCWDAIQEKKKPVNTWVPQPEIRRVLWDGFQEAENGTLGILEQFH